MLLIVEDLATKDKELALIHIILWNLILEKKTTYSAVAISEELKLLS